MLVTDQGALIDCVGNPVRIDPTSRYAVENGHMTEAETTAWFDEQIERANQGRFFFSLTCYRMSAIKT